MWAAIVLGWPAVVMALTAFAAALRTGRTSLGFAGAAIATPFCLYVNGYPLFHWTGAIACGANFLAAFLIHRGRRDVAFTVLLPFLIIVTVLAVFALRHIRLLRG